MKHNEGKIEENQIQLSISHNVSGLCRHDGFTINNKECIITSSQLANQLKETVEFEKYFLYAKNGINLPSLGVGFGDFCKIILDHKFDDMDEDENGIQHLCKTMSLDEFVELFIIWKELDFDDQNNNESENAYKNIKSYLYESDCYELNQRVNTINKYLSEKNKLKIDEVKKIIEKKTDSKIIQEENSYKEGKSSENKDQDKQIKIKWWKNIWLWRFLSLGATVLNLILMIVFMNVWFYFIATLVIWAIVTLVLFFYEPAPEEKIKEELEDGEGDIPFQNNQFTTEKYPNLQMNQPNKQTILNNN